MSQAALQTKSEVPVEPVITAAADPAVAVVPPIVPPVVAPVVPPAVEPPAPKVSDSGKKPDAPVVFDLKLPEGSLLEKGHVDEIASFAKEKGLSAELAQNLLDRESTALNRNAKAQMDAWNKQSDAWVKQVETDKEIGGDNLNKNVELAHRVLKKFGSEELGKELERTSLGNHPELLRLAVRIGKAMGEDTFVQAPKGKSSTEKSAAETLYPTHYQGDKK